MTVVQSFYREGVNDARAGILLAKRKEYARKATRGNLCNSGLDFRMPFLCVCVCVCVCVFCMVSIDQNVFEGIGFLPRASQNGFSKNVLKVKFTLLYGI